MLAAEESNSPDCNQVERLTSRLLEQLASEPDAEYPQEVIHFLDDADIRAKDDDYAEYQREAVRRL